MDLSRVDLSLYYIKNRNVTMTYVIVSLLGSRDHDILRLMERGEVKWEEGRERVEGSGGEGREREREGGRDSMHNNNKQTCRSLLITSRTVVFLILAT